MTGKCYRHGDVSFHPISEAEYKKLLKADAKAKTKKDLNSFVVALGEVTGHKHVMTMEKEKSLTVSEMLDGSALFKMNVAGAMTHEEHTKIVMDPGFYVRKIEREFDPFLGRDRSSLD